MQAKSIFFGALFALAAGPALAQGANAINMFGTIDKVDGASVTVTPSEGGAQETLRLDPKLIVLQNKAATLADIQPKDFVASAAVRKEDGKLHSTELRIFPEAMRGVGEGQRPMNDPRSQTMTNATVTGAAVVNGSNNIKVTFEGGKESELILDPGVPVTRIDAADKMLLKTGVKVRVQGARNADGAVISRITIQ